MEFLTKLYDQSQELDESKLTSIIWMKAFVKQNMKEAGGTVIDDSDNFKQIYILDWNKTRAYWGRLMKEGNRQMDQDGSADYFEMKDSGDSFNFIVRGNQETTFAKFYPDADNIVVVQIGTV